MSGNDPTGFDNKHAKYRPHELYQSSIISPIVLVPDDTQVADGASISIAFPIDRKVQRRMQRGAHEVKKRCDYNPK